jgi:tetratricopeptide (TPR) repeat protein
LLGFLLAAVGGAAATAAIRNRFGRRAAVEPDRIRDLEERVAEIDKRTQPLEPAALAEAEALEGSSPAPTQVGPLAVPSPPEVQARKAEAEQRFASLLGERAAPAAFPAAGFEPTTRAPESYLDEGNVYFGVGQYSLASDRYTRALALKPEYGAAYYNRANAWVRLGDLEAAEADYTAALALMADDADVLNNRGMLRLRRGDMEAAEGDFSRAVELRGDDVAIRTNHGLTLMKLSRAEEALSQFVTALQSAPEDPGARYGAAASLASLGRNGESLDQLRYAVFIDPEYAAEAAVDPAFDALRTDEEFSKILRHAHDRTLER